MNNRSMDWELIDLNHMTYALDMTSEMITDCLPEEGNECIDS